MTDSTAHLPNIQDLGPRFLEFLESLQRPVVFFDIESTGTDTQRDRIIELCLLRVCPLPTAVEAPRVWRVNPTVKIPAESSRIHGIVDDDIREAPTFADVADEVIELIEGCDLAGFNISRFDIRMLQQELVRAGKSFDLSAAKIVDAQVIFHKREPRNLSAALKFYCDDEHVDAHGAVSDTERAGTEAQFPLGCQRGFLKSAGFLTAPPERCEAVHTPFTIGQQVRNWRVELSQPSHRKDAHFALPPGLASTRATAHCVPVCW